MKVPHARNPLRRARLAARLELRDLAERTRISPTMLRHMDEGDFHRLPGGIYARAWVRSVALALSIDPDDALRQLDGVLPGAALLKDGSADEPHPPPPPAPERPRWEDRPARWPTDVLRRAAVAVLDGTILTAITAGVWIVTALVAGSSLSAIGPGAVVAITVTALTVAVAYFAVFAGIGGRTPGAALVGSPGDDRTASPLNLARIGRRALTAATAEASIIVDLLVAGGLDEILVGSAFRRT